MKLTRRARNAIRGFLLALLAACAGAAAANASSSPALPDDSIYQLSIPLIDQNGTGFQLGVRRGRPMLVSMFYSSCQRTCPLLISALKSTEGQLTAAQRARLSILVVSFDPRRDDVAKLQQTAEQHGVALPHWTLARAEARDVRKLAAVLGVQYRALPDGDFSHSNALLLIDAEGRIAGRTSRLGRADPEFVKLLRQIVKAGSN